MRGWSEDRWSKLRATYYAMCARVDAQLGMVIDALQETGIYDDTALFFFSDHGDFTGDYGLVEKTENTFEDCLTHVPLVIKPPKDIPVNTHISDALVELVDFPATVEALTDIPVNHTHFGRSLLPLIAGETTEHRDAVFSQGGHLSGDWKTTPAINPPSPTHLYWPRASLSRQEGAANGKATMIRTHTHKYVHRLYEQDELYNLQTDPQEQHNRIEDTSLSDELHQLKERLMRFYIETSDVVPHKADQRD
jgi:arylsulfatase A-like enzyme